ncbi:MAG: hypothetical protein AABZ47_04935 [Planctomycetota bacterium]|mgnify:CR=1 FL=1
MVRFSFTCCFAFWVPLFALGCHQGDPVAGFIARMDAAPPEKRVPQWDFVKGQIVRKAPDVGSPAPDFSLPKLSGEDTVTRSKLQLGKPQVLIFGSFT